MITGSRRKNIDQHARQEISFGNLIQSKSFMALGAVTLLYLMINLLGAVMGAQNLDLINSLLVPPLILGIVALTFILRRRMAAGSANYLLWTGMALGAAFWAIAECWWLIDVIARSELSWPSGADFFWLLAYLPMVTALASRVHSLPKNPDRRWRTAMWALSLLIVVLVAGLIILPVVLAYNPANLVEGVLGVLYPLCDLVLLILTIWILSAYQQGTHGRAWVWISAGFMLIAVSDLFFASASTAGAYYPDGKANLLSTLVIDTPYALGYLGWLVGLLMLRDMLGQHRPVPVSDEQFDLVPNTHLFLPTKADDSVILVSQNMPPLFPVGPECTGQPLSRVLGMPEEACNTMLATLRASGILKECSITVTTRNGPQEAYCSGLAVRSIQGEYMGASLLVRMLVPDEALDDLLTDYQVDMVRSIATKTGVLEKEEEEIKRLLTSYHLAYVGALYNRSLAEGGAVMADALQAELLAAAQQHAWQIKLHPGTLLDVSDLSLPAIREALPHLVDVCRCFVAQLADELVADSVMRDVRSQIGDAVHEYVMRLDKHFSAVTGPAKEKLRPAASP